jgi:hypothetical protein
MKTWFPLLFYFIISTSATAPPKDVLFSRKKKKELTMKIRGREREREREREKAYSKKELYIV